MRNVLAGVFFLLLLIGFASYGLADGEGVTFKPLEAGKWTIYSADGREIGTIALVGSNGPEEEAGGYSILPKGGQYLGVVRRDGSLQLSGRHPVITPADAKLYLDVVGSMKEIR